MHKENKLWRYVKDLYKEKLNIPEEIPELLSVFNILTGVVNGLSTTNLIRHTGLPGDFITETTKSYYQDFPGWVVDLDFSPIMVYNNKHTTLAGYMAVVKKISPITSEQDILTSYGLCEQFRDYEDLLKKYGY